MFSGISNLGFVYSLQQLFRDDLFTAPFQGGGGRMCWESMTQWNWYSHYLTRVATSDPWREQASSQWKPNARSTPSSRQRPFSSPRSLQECCSPEVKGIFSFICVSFQGSWTWSKNVRPEMKLGTESSKPEGITSFLYHFWLKSVCKFFKHQKGEGRKILIGIFLQTHMFCFEFY